MPDYPSSEGYTAAQLKTAFDAPATGLKTDLNGLMTELENVTAAGNIGVDAINESDTSADNLQSKLEYLQGELEGIALGDIPDNSITQAKLNSTYEGTLAKKNGEVQTGLNAEKLGGSTLAQVLSTVDARTSTTDSSFSATLGYNVSTTKTLTVKSRFILFLTSIDSQFRTTDTTADTYYTRVALYDCRNNKFIVVLRKDGFALKGTWTDGINTSSGTGTYMIDNTSYSGGTLSFNIKGRNASDDVTVYVKCIQLDGLLP